MHLIICNCLEDKNADRMEKMRQEDVEAKEKTVYESVFKYVTQMFAFSS